MPNQSRLNILIVCIRVSYSFSFLTSSLMSSLYVRWVIFFLRVCKFITPVHFLSMGLSGIIAITSSYGESQSPWQIPLWIFYCSKVFPPAIKSTRQLFRVSMMSLMSLSNFCAFLDSLLSNFGGSYHWISFSQSPRHGNIFPYRFVPIENVLIIVLKISFPCSILSVLHETVCRLLMSNKSPF